MEISNNCFQMQQLFLPPIGVVTFLKDAAECRADIATDTYPTEEDIDGLVLPKFLEAVGDFVQLQQPPLQVASEGAKVVDPPPSGQLFFLFHNLDPDHRVIPLPFSIILAHFSCPFGAHFTLKATFHDQTGRVGIPPQTSSFWKISTLLAKLRLPTK